MTFCPECGSSLVLRDIDGRLRGACESCRVIDWGDHRVSVGIVITDSLSRALLGRRAQPPSLGLWALPSGYVEGGETLADAASREAFEETGVDVELGPIVAVRSMASGTRHGTYVVFLARHAAHEPVADDVEFSELGWFGLDDLRNAADVTPVTRRMTFAALSGRSGLHRRPYAKADHVADLYLSHEDEQ